MSEAIVVPADIYDYHEFLSEVYGGIGRGWLYESIDLGMRANFKTIESIPYCINGYAQFDPILYFDLYLYRFLGVQTLEKMYNILANDATVSKYINANPTMDRMPWDEYCKARNIVRGD